VDRNIILIKNSKMNENKTQEKYNSQPAEGYAFTEIHTNLPFYDFQHAEKKLGVDFECFSDEGFKDFLEEKYLKTLPDLRRNYFKKDLKQIKDLAHSIKGAFV
jgi:hypothetical protein